MSHWGCPEGLYGMHRETPGTGVCFQCGKKFGHARRVETSRPLDVDDWSDPTSFDRDPEDDASVVEDELRAHHITGRPVSWVERPQVVKVW